MGGGRLLSVTNGYVDVATMREHYADSNSVIDAAIIERAIEAASRWIDRLCGRSFYLEAATSVGVYRPDDPYLAWVHDIGTTTGLVVKTDPTGDYAWSETWTLDTDFQLEPRNASRVGAGTTVQPYAWWRIVAIGRKTFPAHKYRDTLQVTARYGWSDVPDDVREACILATAGLVDRKNSPNGIAGFGEYGSVRISRQDPDVLRLLHPYVRMSIRAV